MHENRWGPEAGANSWLCQAQFFTIHTTTIASAAWSTVLSINLFLIVLFRIDADKIRQLEPLYHLLCWGLPALAPLAFLLRPTAVDAGEQYSPPRLTTSWHWCTVVGGGSIPYKESPFDDGPLWRLYWWIAPIWVLFALQAVVYVLVGRRIWWTTRNRLPVYVRLPQENPGEVQRTEVNHAENTMIYNTGTTTLLQTTGTLLCTYVIVWLPSTIQDLSLYIHPTAKNDP